MVTLQEYVDNKAKEMIEQLRNPDISYNMLIRLDKFLGLAESKGANCYDYRIEESEINRRALKKLIKID